ncbi:alpha/beta fold hydrolase [Leptolyngbya sp. FACHB-261]|uniref:alpha/beta fold hydrolase n=1 Tax=Leptolyngbya sp. FACHB-261 TaxID=2692806 RepID=UPI00168484DD|nr:alpha/beta fold hydrolase [Leptolyngbya sp. FACHB-261]MBD2102326.1 alpha/beta fold hydrolase [Leptolyngbya sp. FACHB-261]
MPIIRVNGIDVYYKLQGSSQNELLLLIAGFASDSSTWAAMMPSLLEEYQVLRFDNRGVGQSSAPDGPYSIQQMAADAAALLAHLGVARVHVAGHSMGGQIAQELALSQPEKIQSLLLLSAWAWGDGKFNALIELFGDLTQKLEGTLYQKVLLPWLFTEKFYSTPGAIDQLIDLIEKQPFPPTSHGLYHQSRAILTSDTSNRLMDIRCPTLVLVGQEDLVTPIKFSQQLSQGIPGAELVMLQGGHAFVVESAEAVAQAMLSYLEKQRRLSSK